MSPGPSRRVAVLAPMRSELRPFVRLFPLKRRPFGEAFVYSGMVGDTEVIATLTNIGTVAATGVTERMLDAFDIDHVVVTGIAGGVHPDVAIGDLIVPESVIDEVTGNEFEPTPPPGTTPAGKIITTDELIHDPERLGAFVERGVVAVDMETAAVAAVCERAGCRWSVFRGISDQASDPTIDEAVMGMAKADGSPNPRGIGAFLLRRPHQIPHLVGLARGMRTAAGAAADGAAGICRA